jgi:PH and SEC7 domain-containing protein
MKAEANWKAKSQYLLAEIIKYESYIESLQSAMALRLRKRGEKALEKALDRSAGEKKSRTTRAASGQSQKAGWQRPGEETIVEGEEPPLTPMADDAPQARS